MRDEQLPDRRRLPRHLRPQREVSNEFAYAIRPVEPADAGDVREIYNYYVRNTVVTFDEKTWTIAKWREKILYLRGRGLPFLVAHTPGGQVLGFALVEPMSAKAAYRFSVESSVYLGAAATGKGLGRALMLDLLAACEAAGIRQVVAIITDRGADASIALHERLGFVEIGRMGRVGYKFGRAIGVVHLQKTLKPPRRSLFGRR